MLYRVTAARPVLAWFDSVSGKLFLRLPVVPHWRRRGADEGAPWTPANRRPEEAEREEWTCRNRVREDLAPVVMAGEVLEATSPEVAAAAFAETYQVELREVDAVAASAGDAVGPFGLRETLLRKTKGKL